MDFRILGPLEVHDERGAVPLGGGKPRAVLAVLLLHPGEAVSPDGSRWPCGARTRPRARPRRCRCTCRACARRSGIPGSSRRRRRATGCACAPASSTRSASSAASRRGARALDAGRPEEAAALLREALALWRGPPLADLAFEPFAQAEIARLEEQRLARARAARGGRPRRRAARRARRPSCGGWSPSTRRASGSPASSMLALYRSGRQAEALEAYRDARARLVDDAGVEPGPELQRLHERGARIRTRRSSSSPPASCRASSTPRPRPPLVGRERRAGRGCARTGSTARARRGPGRRAVRAGRDGQDAAGGRACGRGAPRRRGASCYAAGPGARPPVARRARGRAGDGSADPARDRRRRPRRRRRAARSRACRARSRTVPALVLVSGTTQAANGAIALEPLDATAVRAIATYGPAGAGRPDRGAARGQRRRPAPRPRGRRPMGAPRGRAARRRGRRADRRRPRRAALDRGRAGRRRASRCRRPSARRARRGGRRLVCPFKGLAAFDAADAPYFFGRAAGRRAGGAARRRAAAGRAGRPLRPLRGLSRARGAPGRASRAGRGDAARRAAPSGRAPRGARRPTGRPRLADALVADVRARARRPAPALHLAARAVATARRPPPAPCHLRGDGGVRGAVARHAEAAFGRLDAAQKGVGRRLLLRLATDDGAGGMERRRVPLGDLDDDGEVAAVLARLTDDRLLTVDAGAVELAHEALLREWPRLRGWLEEDAEGRRLHRHLYAPAVTRPADPGALPRRPARGRTRMARAARAGRQPRRAGLPRRCRGRARCRPRAAPARPGARRRPAGGRDRHLDRPGGPRDPARPFRGARRRVAQPGHPGAVEPRRGPPAGGAARGRSLPARADRRGPQRDPVRPARSGRLSAYRRATPTTACWSRPWRSARTAGPWPAPPTPARSGCGTSPPGDASAARSRATRRRSSTSPSARTGPCWPAPARTGGCGCGMCAPAARPGARSRCPPSSCLRSSSATTARRSLPSAVMAALDRTRSSGGSLTVRLWDVATRRALRSLFTSRARAVYDVDFHPDGTVLAIAGSDTTVRLLDVATGRQLGRPLRGHRGWVDAVEFSPDGRRWPAGPTTSRCGCGIPRSGRRSAARSTTMGFRERARLSAPTAPRSSAGRGTRRCACGAQQAVGRRVCWFPTMTGADRGAPASGRWGRPSLLRRHPGQRRRPAGPSVDMRARASPRAAAPGTRRRARRSRSLRRRARSGGVDGTLRLWTPRRAGAAGDASWPGVGGGGER